MDMSERLPHALQVITDGDGNWRWVLLGPTDDPLIFEEHSAAECDFDTWTAPLRRRLFVALTRATVRVEWVLSERAARTIAAVVESGTDNADLAEFGRTDPGDTGHRTRRNMQNDLRDGARKGAQDKASPDRNGRDTEAATLPPHQALANATNPSR